MAHNPPREWFTDADKRAVVDAVRRQQRQWHTAGELADRIAAEAAQGKRVVLSPGTADYVARMLRLVGTEKNL